MSVTKDFIWIRSILDEIKEGIKHLGQKSIDYN